ncbi:MAG: hypothetical protein II817_10590 [Bacteroidales bacterium]|nr:hypothetical protein [Bacteroidales bacterium]
MIIIDKIKICFKRDNESQLWQMMAEEPEVLHIGDFEFVRCTPDGMYNGIYCVYYLQRDFGTLLFDRFSDREHKYSWLSVKNHVFYSDDFAELNDLQSVLGEINNITNLDIACDLNFNPVPRIKKLLKRDDVAIVRCGTKIDDKKQEIEGLLFLHPTNSVRELAPTLYFSDADKRKSFVVYDKMKEIKKSGKSYIAEYYGNPKRLYRMEIRLKSDELFRYFKKYSITPTINMVLDRTFIQSMYFEFLFRLLHITYKRKSIGLLEAVSALKDGYELDTLCGKVQPQVYNHNRHWNTNHIPTDTLHEF